MKTYSSTRRWKNETTAKRKNAEKQKKNVVSNNKAKNVGRIPQQILSSSAITGWKGLRREDMPIMSSEVCDICVSMFIRSIALVITGLTFAIV